MASDNEKIKVLIIDDDEDVLLAAKLLLKKQSMEVEIEKNPNKIPFLLNNNSYDVILLDMNYSMDTTSGKEGFHWLQKILELDPSSVVIMITAFGDVNMAVQAIKEGATDFVLKPWQNEKLIATINSASKLRKSFQEVEDLRQTKSALIKDLSTGSEILGQSNAMKNVFAIINKVAKTDANVLILGENGTGKELIAREIHNQSLRNKNAFVTVDMGALSETLFESELFGHKKGAYTDAKEDRPGRFEIAHNGSLFLDEIGNLTAPLQSKLLTVLQNRQVTRLGTNKAIPIDIRLICATNMPLLEMVDTSDFRQDLLYRINTVEIHLPSLRERIDDLELLANHFLAMYSKKYRKPVKKIMATTIKKLQSYHWPGNIRELQHAIERAIIMSEENALQADDFFFLNQKSDSSKIPMDTYNLDEMEKVMVQKALDKHGGNISKAAKDLGLTRASLYRRLEKHGL
ncbi:sigma-54-dependent Fis family transcriptional regulator [Hyphobacterium sp. CCMP332]|nr:sigma-54-dependent Fis family transcriptional regulator [Hyphobacterium sp. CCMP332]